MCPGKYLVEVLGKEIIVFKKAEYTHIGHHAHSQVGFSPRPFGTLYKNTCVIIYDDSEEQDKNVYGHEGHIKSATGNKQMRPTKLMG
jgi:hypothetical protein